VGDELVELLERARVEQQIHALARGQLSGGMLFLESISPPPSSASCSSSASRV
jgi:hypothetical protein